MAKHFFSGPCKWAKVHKPDEKYNKYSIDVFLDDKQFEGYCLLGLKGKGREENLGFDHGWWVSFRRDPDAYVFKGDDKVLAGPPKVIDKDNIEFGDLIGNGSLVTVKIITYPYNNRFGSGVGSRLEAVRVDNLVPYEPKDKDFDPDEPF